MLSVPQAEGGPKRERLNVKIPAGVDNGSKIRLKGKGQPGIGGANGDLIITITVTPHAFFRRDGGDIMMELPVTVFEAALGAKVDVPTPAGMTRVAIPAGSSSGRKMRLKGKGVKSRKSGEMGNMYLVLKVVLPAELDEEAKETLAELAEKYPQEGIRKHLYG